MVVAAARRRIPVAVTEADAHLGLANRLAAPFAKRVFLSFPIEGREPPKYEVVGRPLPESARPLPRADARAQLELPADGPVLLVAGALGGRARPERIRGGDVRRVRPGRAPRERRARLRQAPSAREPPGLRLAAGARRARRSVRCGRSRADAERLDGLGACRRRPSPILVPYPFATGDHQTKNARYFQAAGGAILVPETELGHVPDLVRSLLDDPGRLEGMGTAMLQVARPDAADRIAEELIGLARGRRLWFVGIGDDVGVRRPELLRALAEVSVEQERRIGIARSRPSRYRPGSSASTSASSSSRGRGRSVTVMPR